MSAPLLALALAAAADPPFPPLVNPNCSHCVDEAKRRPDLTPADPVLVWTRGYSDGGVVPLRFFLAKHRVIADSYGTFVYDPDGGYCRGFAPSFKFVADGWRNGVLVLKHADGTRYSGLTGVAFAGPRAGDRLAVVPTLMSTWGEWYGRYPNAVAYHMFPKYAPVELPCCDTPEAVKTRPAKVDSRLPADARVLGVWHDGKATAVPVPPAAAERYALAAGDGFTAVFDTTGGSAAAYTSTARAPRKFVAPRPNDDGVSPPDAGVPVSGKEQPTQSVALRVAAGKLVSDGGNEWDVAGRCVAGPLAGWTLDPVDAVACKWVAWAAEHPTTTVHGQQPPAADKAAKEIAGTSEFLRLLPKPFGVVTAVDPAGRTVGLKLDGEPEAKTWPVAADAEVKVGGWWGRLEQFKPGDRVWAWLALDRHKKPVAVAMLADAASAADIRGTGPAPDRTVQQAWLRDRWARDGLPGALGFVHGFSGELEVFLDHEGRHWGRALTPGATVTLLADEPIPAVVKHVAPWRERTQVRLVVAELAASGLSAGRRIGLKVPPVPDTAVPPDLGRPRIGPERVEWFLANLYCVCGVGKDTCTGHFYTLASCNPNGCAAPNATRAAIRELIAAGKTDREIWDKLTADRGPLATRPHLKP